MSIDGRSRNGHKDYANQRRKIGKRYREVVWPKVMGENEKAFFKLKRAQLIAKH